MSPAHINKLVAQVAELCKRFDAAEKKNAALEESTIQVSEPACLSVHTFESRSSCLLKCWGTSGRYRSVIVQVKSPM
jgi:hypothetical protein